MRQESIRKDVERAFGVLQQRFHILVRPCNLWFKEDIDNIMHACIIIHNMIVELEGSVEDVPIAENVIQLDLEASRDRVSSVSELLEINEEVMNNESYLSLRSDLIDHLYDFQGNQ